MLPAAPTAPLCPLLAVGFGAEWFKNAPLDASACRGFEEGVQRLLKVFDGS